MQISHTLLSPIALRAIVQEFVTRDGTDHSPEEARITTVMRQLQDGGLELHYDPETQSCNIVSHGDQPPA
ncbi:YheU family protein [Aureliella helgolandensis]|uniref:YheU family protein n=1 Tax=Aureliella helgolandensis TaxID=2527968 RepID=UPI0011A391C4|nr:YheU family protein [Aureliella helgolandensis]